MMNSLGRIGRRHEQRMGERIQEEEEEERHGVVVVLKCMWLVVFFLV